MRAHIDLPDELHRQLKAKAAGLGVSMRELATSYVSEGLASLSKGETSIFSGISLNPETDSKE